MHIPKIISHQVKQKKYPNKILHFLEIFLEYLRLQRMLSKYSYSQEIFPKYFKNASERSPFTEREPLEDILISHHFTRIDIRAPSAKG